MEAGFLQLRGASYPEFRDCSEVLKEYGVRINYFGTDDPDEIKLLFEDEVNFPLVDDIVRSIDIASGLGIKPVTPVFVKRKLK